MAEVVAAISVSDVFVFGIAVGMAILTIWTITTR